MEINREFLVAELAGMRQNAEKTRDDFRAMEGAVKVLEQLIERLDRPEETKPEDTQE